MSIFEAKTSCIGGYQPSRSRKASMYEDSTSCDVLKPVDNVHIRLMVLKWRDQGEVGTGSSMSLRLGIHRRIAAGPCEGA